MIWIIVVLVLALVWVLIRQSRPAPTPLSERELPDPQDLLIGRLGELADQARRDGKYEEAQALGLKVAWLKTRPLLGHDDPPTELSHNEQKHLRLAGDLWEAYGDFLADEDQQFAGCPFKPESLLQFPKEYLAQALEMLLAVGEGRVQSVHIRSNAIPPDVLESMKQARDQLDGFVSVAAEELPSDPAENARYGADQGW
jgi:hypothetical protein